MLDVLRYRTPLGWLQLKHKPVRLFVACAGVAFANLLVLLQWGMNAAMLEGTSRTIRAIKADIFLLSPDATDLMASGTLPRRRLDQALADPGVSSGAVLNVSALTVRSPRTKESRTLMVIGFDPDEDILTDPRAAAERHKLKLADAALLDDAATGGFEALIARVAAGEVTQIEVAGRALSIEGLFSQGASFRSDGVLLVSDLTFFRLVARRSTSAVSAITLRVRPGHDIEAVAARLRQRLPTSDTRVMTHDEFQAHARAFQQRKTPVGIFLAAGLFIAFLVGVIVVYEILSADVDDHIGEYATFKAMGYTDAFLLGIILEQALVLAALGFLPGLLAAMGLYGLIEHLAGIPFTMPPSRPLIALVMTLVMCIASGAVATRRLAAADPADIFR